MRKTKIICTLGPATEAVLEDMIRAGMNVARFNFSHGSHEEHKVRMDAVKAARKKMNVAVGIMLDTKGPEVRIKTFREGSIQLTTGQKFTLTTRAVEGDNTIVSVTYEGLAKDLCVGTRLLIDDGLIAFEVIDIVDGTDIVTRVLNDGPLSNRKSINVPGVQLSMPYLSDSDRADILFGIREGVDFIAASFARSAADMIELKQLLRENGGEDIQIIAKIENMDGVRNVCEILHQVDGIMVARGDLGVEVPFCELPSIQKTLIHEALAMGKRVVTATQMLESMIKNPRPTRAEVSDVANAVFDGTSAIMLSGETSVGKYPVQAVQTMSEIAEYAESKIDYDSASKSYRKELYKEQLKCARKTTAIAHATCTTSADIGAKCIVAVTDSGSTARAVSSYRPGTVVIGATPNEKTFHRLSMSWGVVPFMVTKPASGTELYTQAVRAAVSAVHAGLGDMITVTAGMPVGHVTYTNTLRLVEITESYISMAFED